MNRFLYFLPGVAGIPNHDIAAAAGLAYAFPAGTPMAAMNLIGGPSGGDGTLIAYGSGENLEFSLQRQIWQPIRNAGTDNPSCLSPHFDGVKAWLGMYKDAAARPAPEELQRSSRMIDGDYVLLGDGRQWLVPIIRFANGDTRLPRVLTINANGRAVYEVSREYRKLYEFASVIVDAALECRSSELPADDMLWFASSALGVNYRVSRNEVAMLELIDTRNIAEVARMALDGKTLETLIEQVKKKLAAQSESGVASCPGVDECQDIAHLAQKLNSTSGSD